MFSQNIVKLAIAALAATQVVSAQPHRLNRKDVHARVHRRYAQPEIVTVMHTAATVYVDQHGNTIDPNNPAPPVIVTVTAGAPAGNPPAPIITPEPEAPAPEQPVAPMPEAPENDAPENESGDDGEGDVEVPVEEEQPPVEEEEPKPEEPKPEEPKPEEPKPEEPKPEEPKDEEPEESNPAPPSGDKMGIAYSPYHSDGASGRTCKSAEEIVADVKTLKNFSPLRLYAVDCDQTKVIIEAGKEFGMQVMAAVWNMDDTDNELNQLIEQVGDNWDSVHSVMIGNEVVLSGRKSAGDHVGIINAGREKLRGAGYQGPVVAADAIPMYLDHPELCEASDYLAVNAHPYFDGNVVAEEAGSFLTNVGGAIHEACGSEKKIIWTETGWPNQGEQKGAGIPSPENQKTAIKSIMDAVPKDQIVLFAAFDDEWKQDTPETGATEKHWGVVDVTSY